MMTIGYRLFGKGPVKVMGFHGWFGSADDWAAVEPALDGDRYTFAWVDQRGYGRSQKMTGRFTVDEVADDALDLSSVLGWHEFHVMGHSMGAKVAQRVLQRAGPRVMSCVAVTPVPASGVPLDEDTYRFFDSAMASDDARRGLISYSVSDRLSDAWVRHMVEASRRNSQPTAFGAYLASWVRDDFSEQVKGNPVPMLVLVGEHDPALRPELMEATFLRWFPNATLETLGNAGHYPMWETPISLATRIQQFFTSEHPTTSAQQIK